MPRRSERALRRFYQFLWKNQTFFSSDRLKYAVWLDIGHLDFFFPPYGRASLSSLRLYFLHLMLIFFTWISSLKYSPTSSLHEDQSSYDFLSEFYSLSKLSSCSPIQLHLLVFWAPLARFPSSTCSFSELRLLVFPAPFARFLSWRILLAT